MSFMKLALSTDISKYVKCACFWTTFFPGPPNARTTFRTVINKSPATPSDSEFLVPYHILEYYILAVFLHSHINIHMNNDPFKNQ